MVIIEVARRDLNIALLERDVRALCGDVYIGISTRPGVVSVFLSNDADATLLDPVRRLVEQHDATQLTEEQVKAAADQLALESARRARGEILNPADYSQDARLLRLSEKVAWLEREIRDLRGSG